MVLSIVTCVASGILSLTYPVETCHQVPAHQAKAGAQARAFALILVMAHVPIPRFFGGETSL